jgi:hypothetical protein
MSVLQFVVSVCCLACFAADAFAQSRSQSTSLLGGVLSKRSQPVPRVWVMVYDGTSLKGRALSGDDGRFYIPRLENKLYTVVVRRTVKGSNMFRASVTLPLPGSYNIKLSQ